LIHKIVRKDGIPSKITNYRIISVENSYPVYAWYYNNIIYYYTEAEMIYFNPDSSYMFYYMQ